MRSKVYCDASVIAARVLDEAHSDEIRQLLMTHAEGDCALVTSDLAMVEVYRAIARSRRMQDDGADPHSHTSDAMRDITTMRVDPRVLALAMQVPLAVLRSLDAIHVATALMVEADIVLTRDRRMAEACEAVGLAVA